MTATTTEVSHYFRFLEKCFNRIILNKLKDIVDQKLRDNQAGFRKNRSCVDQITTLRLIVEQSLEWNSSFYINFIDYEKAFDSVDRGMLWKTMRHYGIPEKIVNLVRSLYVGTNCQVSHDGQPSEPFQINTGVRQGCLLSPFLFTLAVDWILKESSKGKKYGVQWTPWLQLEDLNFADDLALKGKNSITRQALQWNPQGSRGRGRPRETWRRCMEREMKDVGITWVALSKKAQDRDVWRMFAYGLYPDRGERQKMKIVLCRTIRFQFL